LHYLSINRVVEESKLTAITSYTNKAKYTFKIKRRARCIYPISANSGKIIIAINVFLTLLHLLIYKNTNNMDYTYTNPQQQLQYQQQQLKEQQQYIQQQQQQQLQQQQQGFQQQQAYQNGGDNISSTYFYQQPTAQQQQSQHPQQMQIDSNSFNRSTEGFPRSVLDRATAAKLRLEHYYKTALDQAFERNHRYNILLSELGLYQLLFIDALMSRKGYYTNIVVKKRKRDSFSHLVEKNLNT
jgi:hypothetical protein